MSDNLIKREASLQKLRSAPRCTAKAKRTGQRCRAPAVKGWRACRVHGARGGAPRGRKHGNYKHGLRTTGAVEARRSMTALIKAARALSERL